MIAADPHGTFDSLPGLAQDRWPRKVSDEYTVPLCRTHHRQLHQTGNELNWWIDLDVDPLPIASSCGTIRTGNRWRPQTRQDESNGQ